VQSLINIWINITKIFGWFYTPGNWKGLAGS